MPAAVGRWRRLSAMVQREGLRHTAAALARRAGQEVYLRESHVWLLMRLDEPRPRPVLAQSLRFTRLTPRQACLVGQLGGSVAVAEQRFDRGHQLFAVFEEDRLGALGWAFFGEAPTSVSRTGWIPLPPGYVNLEDTVVAPALRGMGVAPAFYSLTFDDLRNQGCTHVVGKIQVRNSANRRACAKLGWREFAVVHLFKLLGLRRVGVRPVSSPDVEWLAGASRARAGSPRRRG